MHNARRHIAHLLGSADLEDGARDVFEKLREVRKTFACAITVEHAEGLVWYAVTITVFPRE
eukprot:2372514-Prymnesium_polylepis.2